MTKARNVPATRILGPGLTLLAAFVTPIAVAQQPEAYWYGGANAGQGTADIDRGRIARPLQNAGFSTVSVHEDDDSRAFKLLAGYRFNRNFALEGSVFDLGDYGFQSVLSPSANLAGNIRPIGLGFDLVGFLPLAGNNALFARAGLNYARVREYFPARALPVVPFATGDDKDIGFKVGFGVQHDFSDRFAMRAEVERYRLDAASGIIGHANMVSLGVVYRFGASARVAAAPEPSPAPVTAPVAAAPPPVPAAPPPTPPPPAPPAPVRVTLSADSLFDFDSAALKPAGKAELDRLARELRTVDYERITVIGHSDRIGAARYNQDLSLRRAQTVKDYLVSSAQIAAARITATGVDGSAPVTSASQCTMTARAALIACLQPDRRVEVEVVGSRK